MDLDKKNFSMYMPSDFSDKLNEVKSKHPALAPLSKSQAVYYIVASLASSNVDVTSLIGINE